PMTLGATTTITESGGTFNNTVDGAFGLTINAAGGTVTFNPVTGSVGSITPLTSLTITAANINMHNVTTNGPHTYTGTTPIASTTLNTTGAVTRPVTFVQGATQSTTTGAVTATNAANDFLGAVSITAPGATISLVDVNTLTPGTINAGAGSVSLVANAIG